MTKKEIEDWATNETEVYVSLEGENLAAIDGWFSIKQLKEFAGMVIML